VVTTGSVLKTERLKRIEISRLPTIGLNPPFLWFQLQNLKYFSKYLSDVDLVHFVEPATGALLYSCRDLRRKKVVTSFPGGSSIVETRVAAMSLPYEASTSELKQIFWWSPVGHHVTKGALKSIDCGIVCSYALAKEFAESFGRPNLPPLQVIPHAFDVSEGERDVQVDKNLIIYYGRWIWRKGVTHLLKAATKLKKNFAKFQIGNLWIWHSRSSNEKDDKQARAEQQCFAGRIRNARIPDETNHYG